MRITCQNFCIWCMVWLWWYECKQVPCWNILHVKEHLIFQLKWTCVVINTQKTLWLMTLGLFRCPIVNFFVNQIFFLIGRQRHLVLMFYRVFLCLKAVMDHFGTYVYYSPGFQLHLLHLFVKLQKLWPLQTISVGCHVTPSSRPTSAFPLSSDECFAFHLVPPGEL